MIPTIELDNLWIWRTFTHHPYLLLYFTIQWSSAFQIVQSLFMFILQNIKVIKMQPSWAELRTKLEIDLFIAELFSGFRTLGRTHSIFYLYLLSPRLLNFNFAASLSAFLLYLIPTFLRTFCSEHHLVNQIDWTLNNVRVTLTNYCQVYHLQCPSPHQRHHRHSQFLVLQFNIPVRGKDFELTF